MPNQTWKDSFATFMEGRGKIQQLAELTAVTDLKSKAKQNQLNNEAESAYVRKHVWGFEPVAEDEMETTILGNVTMNAPAAKSGNGIGKVAGLLLASVAGAGLTAAYLNWPKSDPANFEDTTVELGLSRIEDIEN